MLGVISSWPTAADKRAKKSYRATNNENNCDPKEETGIRENRETAAEALRTSSNARQTKQPESNEGDSDDPDPMTKGHDIE
jgi:hypothetical protein